MHLERLLPAIALIALTSSSYADSFWDSLPIVGQIKSMVQEVSGNEEGARQTRDNFLSQAPLVSEIKSSVQTIAPRDNKKARRIQKQSLAEFVEQIVDNIPVLGHIKGVIHKAVGDDERGERILKGATTSTAAFVDSIVGGPAGAIAADAAADGIITGIDSAVHKKYRPFGFVEYASKIDKVPPGEHFDTWIGIGEDAMKTVRIRS